MDTSPLEILAQIKQSSPAVTSTLYRENRSFNCATGSVSRRRTDSFLFQELIAFSRQAAVQTTKKRLEQSNTPEAMTLKRDKKLQFPGFSADC
jgi:hypothetical protein